MHCSSDWSARSRLILYSLGAPTPRLWPPNVSAPFVGFAVWVRFRTASVRSASRLFIYPRERNATRDVDASQPSLTVAVMVGAWPPCGRDLPPPRRKLLFSVDRNPARCHLLGSSRTSIAPFTSHWPSTASSLPQQSSRPFVARPNLPRASCSPRDPRRLPYAPYFGLAHSLRYADGASPSTRSLSFSQSIRGRHESAG
ncbi:unnamed protein product, partial [Iphiclides podalirius]